MHTIPKPSGLPTSSIRHGRYRPGRWRLVSMAEGLLGTLLLLQDRAAQRRALAELDSHLLKDLGLTRADVARETAKPFWQA